MALIDEVEREEIELLWVRPELGDEALGELDPPVWSCQK
jgi:hypothetical protein